MNKLKFIDLFAGISGFRIALEKLGLKCVFSAEIDQHAIEAYKEIDKPFKNNLKTITSSVTQG